MSTIVYTPETLQVAGEGLGDAEPVYMVNLVRYRSEAVYPAGSTLPSYSGREAYFERYAPAFNAVAQGEDYQLFWVGNVHGVLVGTDGEAWMISSSYVMQALRCFAASWRIRPMPNRLNLTESRRWRTGSSS